MDMRDGSTLREMLAQLDRSRIDRPADEVMATLHDYDFEFRETLRSRLEALPHGQSEHAPIHAKIPFGGYPVYLLQAGGRELEVRFEQGYGSNLAFHSHRVYALTEKERRFGGIHYFPNNGFILTNKEPCTSLSLIEFGGRHCILYKADSPGSLMKSKPYGVVTTPTGELLAIVIEAGGWFLPKRRIKLHGLTEDLFTALIMAVFHGLVFRST